MIWLPDVLLAAGLKISRKDGWETRGLDTFGPPLGVMIHHTVGPKTGNMPSLDVLTNGRPATARSSALSGPLAHLGLARDGTFYIISARRANHAGTGSWQDPALPGAPAMTSGNTHFIGIECENTGLTNDFPWPDVQMDALRRGVAAQLRKISATPGMCCGHKEYAPRRKIDPLFDMNAFRVSVGEIMAGRGTVRPQIKAVDSTGRPTLRRHATGPLVETIQQKLHVEPVNGQFGPITEAAVRDFQRGLGAQFVADGIVGPKTWAELDKLTG
jgi:N-acetyl-anhydromuramyl-L-alanine amidase AmpD